MLKKVNLKSFILLLILLFGSILLIKQIVINKPIENTGLDVKSPTTDIASTPPASGIEELKFTEEELKWYYSSYKNPYVLHIRKALNGYLSGTNEGMDTPDLVIKADTSDDGTVGGLSSFGNDYYKSKFIVFAINDSVTGGKTINIVFQDKPDKLFNAWVYKLADGTYDLRGFWQNKEFTPEKMKDINIQFREYMEDKEHAL